MSKQEQAIPVKLPKVVVSEIDRLIKQGKFQTRSDALRFAARLIILLEKKEFPMSLQAERYLYEEWQQKLERTKRVSGS